MNNEKREIKRRKEEKIQLEMRAKDKEDLRVREEKIVKARAK